MINGHEHHTVCARQPAKRTSLSEIAAPTEHNRVWMGQTDNLMDNALAAGEMHPESLAPQAGKCAIALSKRFLFEAN